MNPFFPSSVELHVPTPTSSNELIVVQANDIDTTGLDVANELPVDWLKTQLAEADATAKVPGRFTGRLSRSGKADIVVRGKLTAEVRMPCARCLAETKHAVATELSLLLRPRPIAKGHKSSERRGADATPRNGGGSGKNRTPEYEFSAEEADLDEYDGERVVLDGFIREAILLELPSFPLCEEGCEGTYSGSEDAGEDAAPKAAPLLRSQPDPRPSEPRRGPEAMPSEPTHKPFEVLRHLLTEKPLPSDELQGNSARPSAREVRRAARTLQREKPKIRSSMTGRKKS